MKIFLHKFILSLIFNVLLIFNLLANENQNILTVTAEFEDTNVLQIPTSVTVIDEETIKRNNAHHFSDILNLAPNVNFATGASRGRFVQIRGIGERSEFSSPVNYSVGVVVDGIDLTGIATAATTLDVQQVEILRGPQGTLYGANGLAGLINIVSNSPTDTLYSELTASFEEFGGRNLSATLSNSISNELSYRIAVGNYQTDGYMQNVFLNRDDTNDIDETSVRGKLIYEPNDQLRFTTNIFYVNADNGYDAFSLDSNRSTYSDQPGFDTQTTKAVSFITDWNLQDAKRIEAIVSLADSELSYAYDEDWSFAAICDGLDCEGWAYSSFDQYNRENDNQSFDVRLHSDVNEQSSWVLGIYYRNQEVDLVRQYTFAPNDFSSEFNTKNTAVYGQHSYTLNKKLTLTSGLRFENRKADYIDNENINFSPSENMWGGKLSLEYQYEKNKMLYTLISRGYKNGGINPSNVIPQEEREFNSEFMWNIEAGIKGTWLDNTLSMQTSVFYQDRKDIQSKQSLILSIETGLPFSSSNPNENPCPCSFNDYLKNAEGGGISYGIETEIKWQLLDDFELYSSLGLLKTQYKNFNSFTHTLADTDSIPPVPYNMDGRAFAHSPEYQAVLGANYYISDEWSFTGQIEAKDSFYFSDRHEVKSAPYEIINLGINYQQDFWNVKLFVRNLTDKQIHTRGFGSFPNDPRNFYSVNGPYYQFSAPRVIGISSSINF